MASVNVDIASGFEESRSTNVTENIIPHTVNSTKKKPPKNRRIKNDVKIFGFNLNIILYYNGFKS